MTARELKNAKLSAVNMLSHLLGPLLASWAIPKDTVISVQEIDELTPSSGNRDAVAK
jgi:hypothetical protein